MQRTHVPNSPPQRRHQPKAHQRGEVEFEQTNSSHARPGHEFVRTQTRIPCVYKLRTRSRWASSVFREPVVQYRDHTMIPTLRLFTSIWCGSDQTSHGKHGIVQLWDSEDVLCWLWLLLVWRCAGRRCWDGRLLSNCLTPRMIPSGRGWPGGITVESTWYTGSDSSRGG